MSRVLLRLRKGEEVKYLSHRDVIRTFEFALRRARIPVAYSAGFNPRPRMSFGSAVGVGVTSDDERIVLELGSPEDPSDVKEKMNSQLPSGLAVLEAEAVPDEGRRGGSSDLGGSQFQITVTGDPLAIDRAIRELFESTEVRVVRVREGVTKEVDIRPHLLQADIVKSEEGCVSIQVSLGLGHSGGARPQDFVQALSDKVPNLNVRRIHRLKQFRASGS